MASRIYFLLIIALMSIFHPTISFIGKNKEQNCAHVNFWCNSSLLQPCCDANNRCIQYSIGISECVIEEPQEFKSELINSSCTFDRDCRRLLHAECSEDEQCVCKPKNAYRNNKCLPILGEFCTHNHQSCATAYSECINFKCQCKNGYSQRSDNQCMLNIIGENCDDDEFCSQGKFVKCTESKKCDCSFNTTTIDKISFLSILNGVCSENADCFSQNSHCVINKCQCTPGFTPHTFLDGKCDNDYDCMKIKHSECSINNVCSCKNNYVQFNKTTCGIPIWGPCSKNEDCTVINSRCKDNVCQCKPGDVSKLPNNTVCTLRLDQFCITDNHCEDNSVCVDNLCQYKFFSERQWNNKRAKNLGQNCTIDQECLHNSHAECSIDKICVCGENYYEFNETLCLPLLGGFCSNDEDCYLVDNSYCRDRECRCRLHYESLLNDQCLALYLNQACKYDSDCDRIENSTCSKDKKCVCQANHSAFGENQCLAHIGEFCFNTDNCVSKPVTVCINDKCQCIDKFISLQSKDNCVPIILGAPCKDHRDCNIIKNAKCSENNICVCRNNYYALDEVSCGPSINESCSNDDDCMVPSSVCIDNQCQCQQNFSAVSRFQCVKNNLLFSCKIDTDCGDPWHSKCLENKKCGCNAQSILINKSTCLPLIRGLCWADTQCITIKDSSCVDFYCQCNSNTRFIADNMCSQIFFS